MYILLFFVRLFVDFMHQPHEVQFAYNIDENNKHVKT